MAMRSIKTLMYSSMFLGFLNVSALADSASELRAAPEPTLSIADVSRATSSEYMIVTANFYASRAAEKILDAGGSAIDATIAAQAVLTLVEPQSSGIGGGGFLLYWDEKEQKLHTFDGRETAPLRASPFMFVTKEGEAMPWKEAVVGGLSVGVPGLLRALKLAHDEFGRLPWEVLFEDAIRLAKEGFVVSERLAGLVKRDLHPGLKTFDTSRKYFWRLGYPLSVGQTLVNEPLAQTFSAIATQGIEVFYEGVIAERIVDTVRNSSINPGQLSLLDMRDYQAIKRSPVCSKYREYMVCGMGPPSAGGVALAQILNLLEPYDLSRYQPDSAEFLHLFAQANALFHADRKRYLADTDYSNIPFLPLISPSYIKQRQQLIGESMPFSVKTPGKIFDMLGHLSDQSEYDLPSTSHLSLVDKDGNSVALTSSIEYVFGSGLMVGGFLLNNQLTDFALFPRDNNRQVVNRAEPNKRPLSSMSPTMVFDEQRRLKLVIGSPGGSRIPSYVVQAIINILDFNMSLQDAMRFPRVSNRNGYTALEKDTYLEALEPQLTELGHEVRMVDLNSGVHVISIDNGKLEGAADPRREGFAVGGVTNGEDATAVD